MRKQTEERVVLVNEWDQEVGTMEKIEAHRRGVLHRAFSVFIFASDGRLLMQRRARGKYHSGGPWTNTCCGHPRPGETIEGAATRRLREEMGMNVQLEVRFSFIYEVRFTNELIEHELDHVLVGNCGDKPAPDPKEVDDVRWIAVKNLEGEIAADPCRFTEWVRLCLPRVITFLDGLR